MASKLLDDKTKEQVKEFFSELDKPVKMIFFGSTEENCEYCSETIGLLSEIAELNPLIHLDEYDFEKHQEIAAQYRVDKVPMTVIAGMKDNDLIDYGIRLAGIPAGHEFTTLINDLVMVSKQDSGLSPEIREKLASLEKPVNLQVFVTPTCPYCPQAVILAHQMAMESELVTGEMVEAMEFVELSNQFNVSGVPHTIINSGSGEVVGAVPETRLMVEIEKALSDN
ncbi:MAG: thioredoxin family protein [Anaerolineaceae bacterium]|jgi:glutaredoxin-like protein|nr:thioredoxin family protein [Anaerolineaceae bacterium]